MLLTHDDIFNPIEGKKQDIIELFVGFYGEEWREKITNRINNTEFFFLDKDPYTRITNFYRKKLDELEDQFYDEIGIKKVPITRRSMLQAIKRDLEDLKRELQDFRKGKVKWFSDYLRIKAFTKEVGLKESYDKIVNLDTSPQDVDNCFQEIYDRINNYLNIWEEKYASSFANLQQEYRQHIEPLKESAEKFDSCEEKYIKQFKDKIFNYVAAQMQGVEMINYHVKNFSEMLKLGKDKLGDEFLVSPYTMLDYMETFNALGYDCGDNYIEYINNEDLMEKIFNPTLLDDLNKTKKEHCMARMENNASFAQALTRIQELDVKDGNWTIVENIYNYLFNKQDGMAAAYCQYYVDSKNQIKTICVFPLGMDLNNRIAIHELGHIIQSDILSIDEESVTIKSGLIKSKHKFEENFDKEKFASNIKQEKEITICEHELLNEVIHDYLMQKLAKEAKQRGLSFYNTEEDIIYYIRGFMVMRDFINQNLELIKDCQMDEHPNGLAEKIGMTNFEQISNIVISQFKIGSGDQFYYIIEEIQSIIDLTTHSIFDAVHMDYNWSNATKAFLDSCAEAEVVFDRIYEHQQGNKL